MGHKVHPVGFRIGITQGWQSKWYSDKHYAEFLHEDLNLRQAILSKYAEAGISLVEIERQANKVSITIHTARPGIVIGRGGQRVDELRHYLDELIGKKVQLNIQEVRQPELDANLVARSIAEQIERRVGYRRAMKQAIFRATQAGAKGIRISIAGRLGGAEIARRVTMHEGQVPLHTLSADLDYGLTEARTTMGRIGIKTWIYKGLILPAAKEVEVEEAEETPPIEAVAEETPSEAEPTPVPEKKPRTRRRKVATAEAGEPGETPAEPEAPSEAVKLEEKPAKSKASSGTAEQVEEPGEPDTPSGTVKLEEGPAEPEAPADTEAITTSEEKEQDATT